MEDLVPSRPVGLVRISDDRTGDALGVARQEEDVRTLAQLLRWPDPIEVIVENDTSAFARRKIRTPGGRQQLRTVRPGFRHVLDMLENGEADALIAYDLDRAARDPRDLEDLIDVVEHTEPRVAVRSVTGSLRLDNDADVTMARVMVAIANKASRDASRRIKRKMDEIAAAGRPGGGGRPFGYEADHVTIRQSEADVIRDAAARVLTGETVLSVCEDLNRRKIRPVRAEQWSPGTLHQLLRSGRIAGLRTHRGEIVGPATWPGIITTTQRDALLAKLAQGTVRLKVPNLRYWCGRLLWCGRCGAPMVGICYQYGNRRTHNYWCSTQRRERGCGHTFVSGPHVETVVASWSLEALARPDALRLVAAGSPAPAIPRAARRVVRSQAPATAWERLQPVEKRELVRALLVGRGFTGWAVAPADKTSPPRFDPSRLSLATQP